MTFDNGDRYKGNLKNARRNEHGTYLYENGDRYKGNWKNGYKHYVKFDPTDSSRFNLLFSAWCKARRIL
jgi:hypothetical protein